MKYNKIIKENDYNKNSFLITCVCSVLLLLTLCYFGVNSGTKGTYSVSYCLIGQYYNGSGCAACPKNYYCPNQTPASGMSALGHKKCPDGQTTSGTGATSIADCQNILPLVCNSNQYLKLNDNGDYDCDKCPKDHWCNGETATACANGLVAEEGSGVCVASKYTIYYYANGGSVSPSSQTVEKNTFVTLPTPTKNGDEIFAGWYTSATGGSFKGKGGTSYYVTQSQTLYAHWVSPDDKKCYQCSGDKSYVWSATIPNSSCVEVNKTHDECEDSAQSSGTTSACYYCSDSNTYKWSATVPGGSCTKAQYYTKSACESAGSGSQNPDPGPDPTPGSGGSDEKVTYKATFDPNGGKLEGNSTKTCSADKGGSCIIPELPTANRNGYTYEGWGTSKTCTSGNKSSVKLSSDKTFYACWQKTGGSSSNGDGNADKNPPTGQTTTIAIIWFVGLLAVGYAFYYFKKVREN